MIPNFNMLGPGMLSAPQGAPQAAPAMQQNPYNPQIQRPPMAAYPQLPAATQGPQGVPQSSFGPHPGIGMPPPGGPLTQGPQGVPQSSFGPHPQFGGPAMTPGLRIGMPPPGAGQFQSSFGPHPGIGMPPPGGAPVGPQAQQGPPQSLEQQALAGGGVSNKQQISNFMSALGNMNEGGNNAYMGTAAPPPPQAPVTPPQPLLGGAQVTPQPIGNGVNLGGMQVQQQPNTTGVNLGGMQVQPKPPAPGNGLNLGGMQVQPKPPAPGNGLNLGGMQVNQIPKGLPGSPGYGQSQGPIPQIPGMMMSDERQKQNVESAEPSLQHFLSSIGAHNYQYKNPERDGVGVFTSPMAQELERTALGKQAVINTPQGKRVDYARLGGVNLAAVSVVHRETQKLKAQVSQLRAALRKVK